jgi:integrase
VKNLGTYALAVQEYGVKRKEVDRAKRLGVPYCPDVERAKKLVERRQRIPFTEIAQDFLDYAKANKRDQQDGQRMERLLTVFGGKLAAEITPQDVEAYKSNPPARRDLPKKKKAGNDSNPPKPLSPATVNRDLALLKATFNRALMAGKVETNPVKAVKLFKENNARVRCLTDEEEARLYDALPDYLKPFLVVAVNTGMRWGELARLTWEDVDFYTGTLHVRESKSGEGRHIPMNRVVRETLQTVRVAQVRWAQGQTEGEREIKSTLVFCAPQGGFLRNFSRDWYPALQKANVPNFRWHDTRHTAASRLVMAGVDLYTVKEILGHKTLAMTARYSHLSPGHQRQALERLADRQTSHQAPNSDSQVALSVAQGK